VLRRALSLQRSVSAVVDTVGIGSFLSVLLIFDFVVDRQSPWSKWSSSLREAAAASARPPQLSSAQGSDVAWG
jgi:hypothetical protein